MAETILIVDDEDSVRRTFQDWLAASGLNCEVVAAADAEQALLAASKQPIDLAVLDWNLGSGSDGLRLLQDLSQFQPDIVAILVTGFAHQATPLDALRMGVRDYLDKNQTLSRKTFLAAVRKQLERIVPAKRQRQFVQKLVAFREAVERVLPLARAAAALNDPVPLPEAVRGLFRFVLRTTRARDGVLVVRQPGADGGAERLAVYDPDGQRVAARPVPFARSLAASVLSLQEPCAMGRPESSDVTELQPFEEGRTSVLAAPVPVGEGVQVVVELFDKQPRSEGEPIRFTEEDKRFLAAAAEFGAELLRQALAERQTHQLLLDAVAAALEASERVARDIQPGAEGEPGEPPSVLDRLREGLSASAGAVVDAESSLRLAEAIRELAARHGPAAVRHCVTLVEGVRRLLDETSGTWEG